MTIDIQAFIFDMDGVITDTVETHYQAFVRLTQEENVPFDRDVNDYIRGMSRMDAMQVIFDGQGVDNATLVKLAARKNSYYHELLRDYSPANRLPGVTELINEIKASGRGVGLASSSGNGERVLRKLELWDTFDAFGDANTVANTKPAPDVFLWVAGALGVKPEHALVIEDSKVGVEAANGAGFWTLGLGDHAEGANIHLPDLSNATVDGILGLLNGVLV